MTLINFDDGARFAVHCSQLLSDLGIKLTFGHNFDTYRSILEEARPNQILGAPFDPDLHDLNVTNAFWTIGYNDRGEVIHTQAMRMIDTGNKPLAEYLRYNFRDFPPPGIELDLNRSRFRAGPSTSKIRGSTCYHGEFWIGGAPGEYRGTGLASILGRNAFWEAMNRWDPDYVFSFIEKTVANKGFAVRQAYLHCQPGALRWFRPGVDKPIEGYIGYMDRDEMRFVLEMPLPVDDVQVRAA